ncbi:unnamed protein product [Mytilus edulis]|uniref:Uncharacterized protein n=1 Tax=Mytilus edulis TaxID=6550 RepID=A0A8S3RCY0_MYTED|nr:unnamed protein product [Mytilus edulis]
MEAKNGYQFKLSKVYFNVDPSEIVAENEVPISLISALRDLLFGCGMENDEGVRNGSQTSEVENEENQTSCCNKFEQKIQTACCQNNICSDNRETTTSHEATDNVDQEENTTSHEVTDNVDQDENTTSHEVTDNVDQQETKPILYEIGLMVNELRADEITKQEMKDRKYKAFKVSNESITEGNIGTYDRDPKFKTKGVVLLFDKDKQYTTKKFFFNICKKLPDGPGPYSKRYGIALRHFCRIFSKSAVSNSGRRSCAWILMKTNILFSQDDPPDVDEICERYFHKQKNSESDAEGLFNMFKKTFDDEIEKDSKWWIIGDMDVTDKLIVDVEPSKADLLIWKGRESTCTKRKTVENPTEIKHEDEGLI